MYTGPQAEFQSRQVFREAECQATEYGVGFVASIVSARKSTDPTVKVRKDVAKSDTSCRYWQEEL